jgi:magnesium-transporting ATPase (P-type)
VTGPELEAAGDAELEERVRDADVYARVAPEHKLRLVRALQAQGEIVAMTGDGVNDAPALRQADIGVAMGRGGSAAAKEAADMVLADDDFGTLRAAIEEGRRVYDNLVKALSFVLPTSLGQALIIAVVLALQALFVAAPFMHEVFGAATLDAQALVLACAASLVILPVTWVEERWRRRRARARSVVLPRE